MLRKIKALIKSLTTVNYYKNDKRMTYVLTDLNGYKYYAFMDNTKMHTTRYSELYIPKMIELQTRITESDMIYFLDKCKKFTNVQQYRDAHTILEYKSGIMFNPSTVWDIASIVLHRQDEKENEISKTFHNQKIKDIKDATIGGVADFFQLIGLTPLLNLEDMSETSLMLLTESMELEISRFREVLEKISSQTQGAQ